MQNDRRQRWLLYGAYGFTGRLIAEEAARRGSAPLLAGRDAGQLAALANTLGLPHRVLALDQPAALRAAAREVGVVVNAAAPFPDTAPPLIEACLDRGTHYLDISGELHHLRAMADLDARARAAGVAVLSGAGFGVTVGECLALHALDQLPDATRLRLSVAAANAQTTPTVRRTIVGVLARGGYAVVGGQMQSRPLAHQRWTLEDGGSPRHFAAAPMGELEALRRSCGLAEIVVGRPMPPLAARLVRGLSPVLPWLLSVPAVARRAGRGDVAPAAPAPAGGWRSQAWAEVANDAGEHRLYGLVAGEGYHVTAQAVLANLEALQAQGAAGARTPGSAFGAALLARLPDLQVRRLDAGAPGPAPVDQRGTKT